MNNPNSITGIPYLDEDDHAKGFEAIKQFHNFMVDYYPDKYKIKLDLLISSLASRAGGKYFLDGLGLGIQNAKMTQRQVTNAMERLARESKGMIPANNNAFFVSLTSSASVSEWVDLPTFVIVESAKDLLGAGKVIGEKVINIGESALDSVDSIMSNAKYILPVVLIIGVVATIYFNRVNK
jgi:hypothetical protein